MGGAWEGGEGGGGVEVWGVSGLVVGIGGIGGVLLFVLERGRFTWMS